MRAMIRFQYHITVSTGLLLSVTAAKIRKMPGGWASIARMNRTFDNFRSALFHLPLLSHPNFKP
jgi:hypothetical protein